MTYNRPYDVGVPVADKEHASATRPAGVAARVALLSGPHEWAPVPALELRQYEPADSDAVWDLHEPDDAGVIRRIRVDPDHQRREFGSTLLAALEACAPELGFDRLVLDTTPRQAAAMVRYEECLFE